MILFPSKQLDSFALVHKYIFLHLSNLVILAKYVFTDHSGSLSPGVRNTFQYGKVSLSFIVLFCYVILVIYSFTRFSPPVFFFYRLHLNLFIPLRFSSFSSLLKFLFLHSLCLAPVGSLFIYILKTSPEFSNPF
jgi:hypothetical protein